MNKKSLALALGITFFVAGLGIFGSLSVSDDYRQTMAEVAAPVLNPFNLLGASEQERMDGGYYALVDEQGNVLDLTALRVYKDDEFISADNRRYRVTKVVNDTAQCRFIGTEVIAYEEYEEPVLPQNGGAATAAAGAAAAATGTEAVVPAVANKPVVGIYHTHGDESYRPSQGYSSAPAGQKGGVSQVAETLKGELEKQGITALYNDATHSPHDSGAYHRSRRTATTLMKQGAQVLIDVHRDAVPASAYRTQIDGQNVSQVKLVVGKRNPTSSASLNYAKKVKGFLDKHYPGLAKGIFIGKGVYNQDLRATNLLVEVGTDKITLDEAKRGVTLLANTLPNMIGGGGAAAGAGGGTTAGNEGAGKAIGWLIGAVVLGGLGFLLISTGSFKGAANKLRHFGSAEWTNYFGRRRTKEIIKEEELAGAGSTEQYELTTRERDLSFGPDRRVLIKETESETTAGIPLKTKTGPTSEGGFLWEAAEEINLPDKMADKSRQTMERVKDRVEAAAQRQRERDAERNDRPERPS